MGSNVLPFIGVSLLVILAPGPDMALVTRNTLVGGRTIGLHTAVGVAAGLSVWSLATALGLAAVLRASEPAFVVLKLAGAAYLVFLGSRTLYGLFTSRSSGVARTNWDSPRSAPSGATRQGVISNLGNPKIAVFFTSFLPQFSGHSADFFSLLLLGLVFCGLTLLCLASYALVVARAGDFLRRSAIRRAVDGLTGIVLIGLGVRLATEHR